MAGVGIYRRIFFGLWILYEWRNVSLDTSQSICLKTCIYGFDANVV